jgi:hypothetical protein
MTMYVAVLLFCVGNDCGFTNSNVLHPSEAACQKAVYLLVDTVPKNTMNMGLCVPIKLSNV